MKRVMVRVQLVVVALLSICSINVMANGGTAGGGGVDNYDEKAGAAWFLGYQGHHKIQTCYVVNEKFGFTNTKIEENIRAAFKTWEDYFEEKQVNYFFKDYLRPVTQIEILPKCNGKEDLKIYFGISDSKVEHARVNKSVIALSFQTEAYDEGKTWSRGAIWIAQPMSVKNGKQASSPVFVQSHALLGLLLHEIGHVLGCGHVEDTIMRPDLGKYYISNLAINGGELLKMIDHHRELVPCWQCQELKYSSLSNDFSNNFMAAPYAFLVAHESSGDIKSELILHLKHPPTENEPFIRPADLMDYEGILKLTDLVGTVKLPLTFKRENLVAHGDNNLFFEVTSGSGMAQRTSMESVLGSLKLPNGKNLSVTINRNAGGFIKIMPTEIVEGMDTIFVGDPDSWSDKLLHSQAP